MSEGETIGDRVDLLDRIAELETENARLNSIINTPTTDDWFLGVRLEAAHQIERWSAAHDMGKSELDWFWLIGYLSQKVVTAGPDKEKAMHHTISTAAVLLNWHRHITGEHTDMRPGIATPEGES